MRTDPHFASDPLTVVPGVRRVLAEMDSSMPLTDVKTIPMQIDETQYVNRIFAYLAGAFGVLSTLLAAIGLYGITAFSVARRTREIGVRIGLGASPVSVLGLVTREILVLTIAGFAIGIPFVFAGGKLVQAQLFGMRASDLGVTGAAAAIIAVTAVTAAALPGWRAARVHPTEALRYE